VSTAVHRWCWISAASEPARRSRRASATAARNGPSGDLRRLNAEENRLSARWFSASLQAPWPTANRGV
jgi:hypothetical protein